VSELLIMSVVVVCGVALWLLCATLCDPRPASTLIDWVKERRELARGPKAFGLPIEQLAVDLRRLMREHDRLVRPDADWHRAHHLRACEMALRERAEEAATALGLPPSPTASSRWTPADLAARLNQLAEAGLVLPEIAGMGGDLL
jgi:hypothetical protein